MYPSIYPSNLLPVTCLFSRAREDQRIDLSFNSKRLCQAFEIASRYIVREIEFFAREVRRGSIIFLHHSLPKLAIKFIQAYSCAMNADTPPKISNPLWSKLGAVPTNLAGSKFVASKNECSTPDRNNLDGVGNAGADRAEDNDSESEVEAEKEFVVETSAVVVKHSSNKDHGWIPETITIQGQPFSILNFYSKSRKLAAMFGLKCSDLKTYCGSKFIKVERDTYVDTFIFEYFKDKGDDGMTIDEIHKHREKFYAQARVPLVADLDLPDGPSIKVATCARKNKNPQVVLTSEFMNWLAKAKTRTAELEKIIANRERIGICSKWHDEDLPDLPQPFKYRKRGNAIALYRTYTNRDGRVKQIQRTVATSERLDICQVDAVLPVLIREMDDEIKNASM